MISLFNPSLSPDKVSFAFLFRFVVLLICIVQGRMPLSKPVYTFKKKPTFTKNKEKVTNFAFQMVFVFAIISNENKNNANQLKLN